jgi:hypothetical protein
MTEDSSYSGKIAVRASTDQTGTGVGEVHFGKGTVFVRPAVLPEPSDLVQFHTDFNGPWLVLTNGVAKRVDRELLESGRSFSVTGVVEASAFGCDSKVLERAVRRLLESAAGNALDAVEITGLTRRQDTGLEYISIRALGTTVEEEPVFEAVGRGAASAVLQLEG